MAPGVIGQHVETVGNEGPGRADQSRIIGRAYEPVDKDHDRSGHLSRPLSPTESMAIGSNERFKLGTRHVNAIRPHWATIRCFISAGGPYAHNVRRSSGDNGNPG